MPTSRTVNGKPLSANITLSAGDVSAVPTTRKVNNKALSADITLTAADVGARASTWTPTAADVGAVPTSRTVNGKALSSDITLTAGDVGAGPGKRTARFTVGTSAAGWTAADCDYLCDGTADDVEINAAIQALPSTGGEIVILDGTYNITATIAMNKDDVKLSGNGNATVLKRMWNSSTNEGVITVTATNGGCYIENLCVDGNEATYDTNNSYGIYMRNSSNNTITGNTCNSNNSYGIYMYGSNTTITGNTCNSNSYGSGIYINGDNNTITGNTCYNSNNSSGIYISDSNNTTITGNTCYNNSYGIYMRNSSNNTITGNTCNSNTITGNTCYNNNSGIYMYNSDNSTVTGNTCIRGSGTSSDYTSSQYTIRLGSTGNNHNLIAYNNIMGKNYASEGGTGNTFTGNKYN